MKREDLEHLIRAAATISKDDDIVVIGSQAMPVGFRTVRRTSVTPTDMLRV
ncbi:MAG: hypothetical protein AAF447_02260 [Myxococcota bacterium]